MAVIRRLEDRLVQAELENMRLDACVRELVDWKEDDIINGRAAATRGLALASDTEYRVRKAEEAHSTLCLRTEILEARDLPEGSAMPKLPTLQWVQDDVNIVSERLDRLVARSDEHAALTDARLQALENQGQGA